VLADFSNLGGSTVETWGDYQIREYTWSTLGVHLEYTWSTLGVHLEYTWSTLGVHLEYTLGDYQIRKLFKTPISGFKRIRILFRGYKPFSFIIIFCVMNNNVISG